MAVNVPAHVVPAPLPVAAFGPIAPAPSPVMAPNKKRGRYQMESNTHVESQVTHRV